MRAPSGALLRNPPTKQKREGRCIVELIQSQAATNPDALAVVHGSEKVTYEELEARSNQVAHHLISLHIAPEAIVGLCLDHSIHFVIAALGILKAGAAYLPLDPSHPPERLSLMMKDAGSPFLVTDSHRLPYFADGSWNTINVDNGAQVFAAAATKAPEISIQTGALAYVIYTSGSTGKPKAVEVTHANLTNLVRWHIGAFNINRKDRAPFMAAVGFDAAVWELWPYLAAGASVHLFSDACIYNCPGSLRDWLVEQKITIGFIPTPLAEQMIELDWPRQTALRFMLTGADILHKYPSPKLPFQLINNYGPTECTVVATSGIVDPGRRSGILPSIGKPIDHTQIYILDANRGAVPEGTVGEVYIGGAGVARGYRNDPFLTAQKFIRNPFSPNDEDRLYRTGDIGYFLDDGQIAFVGRADDQVKIGARRVEINEIVAVLSRHPAVGASAVVAREDAPGSKHLVAYVVAKLESELTPRTLREFLMTFLPEYMVPAVFVRLDKLPLSSHGKVDRQALPLPDGENTLRDEILTSPRTELEAQVGAILSGLLATNDLGVNDNFFLLGGNSFLGIQVIAGMRERFGVELPLRSLFETPTVAGLSAQIAQLLARTRAGKVQASKQSAAD